MNEVYLFTSDNIRIYHELEERIDDSVLRVTVWHHKTLKSDAAFHKHPEEVVILYLERKVPEAGKEQRN